MRRRTRDQVCKVGSRSIVFGAYEGRERHVVAVAGVRSRASTQITINLRIFVDR